MKKQKYTHNKLFTFESGESINSLELVYHISSDFDPENRDCNKKVVWICHALTANSDPTDWWVDLVGHGKLLDPKKYTIICVNTLGSPYGSSGPSSIDNATGSPYYFRFPEITTRDIATTFSLVRKHLKIDKIDLLIGCSVGGFHALEWSIMETPVIEKAAYIACSYKVTPWFNSYNETMRMVIETDSSFRKAEDLSGGREGLMCARAIGLISYRSYEGYNLTQTERDTDFLFASNAGSYQRYQGLKLANRFDAYSYYYLTKTADSGNVGRKRGGCEIALSKITAKSIVVGTDSDKLFPIEEQKFIEKYIPDCKFHLINSKFGHDGFLIEFEQLKEIIKSFFN